jgi:hypothetical protein
LQHRSPRGLLNRARQSGADYQTLLTSYCLERFLYRLSVSDRSDRFILKGAMLLRVWSDQPYRATRDLDLLRRGEPDFQAICDDLAHIVATRVSADAVAFDSQAIQIDPIRTQDEYAGARATFPATLGTARITLQVDMGVGDTVWPPPTVCAYPTLLDLPAPAVLAYPKEAVIAEKFEAMVVLGDRNSRIKDFFDVHYLATRFEFDRGTLREAIHRTFQRSRTPIPQQSPIAPTAEYWQSPTRPAQMRAFAKRAAIAIPDHFDQHCSQILQAFLTPFLDDLRTGGHVSGTWRPGGPWN